MRAVAVLAAVLLLAPGAAAQEPQSAGATEWFGRGIVRVREQGTEVQLDLKTESQGMLLRLAEGQPITIVAIGPFAAGLSTVRIPPEPSGERVTPAPGRPVSRVEVAVPTTLRREVPIGSTEAVRAPREYLLLVLSDRPIDSTVTRRIGTIPGFDPATAAHDLPEFLVGRRSPMWAGYLARP
jgi:hypothetical protein